MAASQDEPPSFRRDSPSPETAPAPALGSKGAVPRCISTASSVSRGSSTDGSCRDSLGSDAAYSRLSSSSYQSRMSTASFDKPLKRRGYSRPMTQDFSASAKHRDSVLSLGSISHLQYYFARTGLLDGKGGQLSRKKHPRATLDLSSLDSASYLNPNLMSSDVDSSYASMGSSPDFGGGQMVESPMDDNDGFDSDEFEDPDPDVLPPTTSTYNHREKPVPKPPTIEELKADLTQALDAAAKVLAEASPSAAGTPTKEPPKFVIQEIPARSPKPTNDTLTPDSAAPTPKPGTGWHQIQGMQVLDVMTLAIRAAKVYYTSHEQPDRLDAIKSEKEIRSDLLSVMEVLKHMATRDFAGGTREEEHQIMSSWIDSIRTMIKKDEEMEQAERVERASWTWVKGDWTGREIEREIAFLSSIDNEAEPLPQWTPVEEATQLPTPFLESMQNGVRLVKLHNAAVRKSRRRFGAIGKFHTDTQKPYRCAENLRYWNKAAELRWEVMLKVDVMGVIYNTGPEAWKEFDAAIWQWCRMVREEVTADWQT